MRAFSLTRSSSAFLLIIIVCIRVTHAAVIFPCWRDVQGTSEHVHGILGFDTTGLGDVTLTGLHDSTHASHVFTSGTTASSKVTIFVDALPRVASFALLFSEGIELLLILFVSCRAGGDLSLALGIESSKFFLGLPFALNFAFTFSCLFGKELLFTLLVGLLSQAHKLYFFFGQV